MAGASAGSVSRVLCQRRKTEICLGKWPWARPPGGGVSRRLWGRTKGCPAVFSCRRPEVLLGWASCPPWLVVMKSEIVGGFCVCMTDHLLWAHGGRKTLLTPPHPSSPSAAILPFPNPSRGYQIPGISLQKQNRRLDFQPCGCQSQPHNARKEQFESSQDQKQRRVSLPSLPCLAGRTGLMPRCWTTGTASLSVS